MILCFLPESDDALQSSRCTRHQLLGTTVNRSFRIRRRPFPRNGQGIAICLMVWKF